MPSSKRYLVYCAVCAPVSLAILFTASSETFSPSSLTTRCTVSSLNSRTTRSVVSLVSPLPITSITVSTASSVKPAKDLAPELIAALLPQVNQLTGSLITSSPNDNTPLSK